MVKSLVSSMWRAALGESVRSFGVDGSVVPFYCSDLAWRWGYIIMLYGRSRCSWKYSVHEFGSVDIGPCTNDWVFLEHV